MSAENLVNECPMCKGKRMWQVYEDGKYIYLVMEACMGGELFDVIIKRGHFTEQDAANVARVVLQVWSQSWL